MVNTEQTSTIQTSDYVKYWVSRLMDTINIDNIQYSNHGFHFTGDFGYGILSSVISNLFFNKIYRNVEFILVIYKNNESFFSIYHHK